jgi:hypothetical protein
MNDLPDVPPRLLAEDYMYCETGSLLALNFLRTAHHIVEKAHDWSGDDLRAALNSAFDEFLNHRATCENCNEI